MDRLLRKEILARVRDYLLNLGCPESLIDTAGKISFIELEEILKKMEKEKKLRYISDISGATLDSNIQEDEFDAAHSRIRGLLSH